MRGQVLGEGRHEAERPARANLPVNTRRGGLVADETELCRWDARLRG